MIVDEAGCVAETATPLLLRLHPSNLVLVGDHLQLPAFTALMDPPRNHCRWAGKGEGRGQTKGWVRGARALRLIVLDRRADRGVGRCVGSASEGAALPWGWWLSLRCMRGKGTEA